MIVTELKQKGKSQSYYIELDGEKSGTLELETIVKNHLKVGSELDDQIWLEIKHFDDNLTCFSRALKYISSRLKTEKQMREYLHGLNYLPQSIDNAITKLKDYGYINDDYYANTFVDVYGSAKGKNYLKRELAQKGVKQEFISNALQDKDDTAVCMSLCQKKLKSLSQPLSQKDRQKIYRFLLSRGFEYETIKHCLSQENIGEEDDWN